MCVSLTPIVQDNLDVGSIVLISAFILTFFLQIGYLEYITRKYFPGNPINSRKKLYVFMICEIIILFGSLFGGGWIGAQVIYPIINDSYQSGFLNDLIDSPGTIGLTGNLTKGGCPSR